MRQLLTPGERDNMMIKILICSILVLSSLGLTGQSLPDFSGTWLQDSGKSDDFYKDFNVKCTITQTASLFTVKTTFSDKNDTEIVTRESIFSLDGKEIADSEGGKKSAKWSPDKKVLTTSDTKDYGGDIVGVKASYSISDDRLVLTVKSSDIKPDVKSITQVFNKKK